MLGCALVKRALPSSMKICVCNVFFLPILQNQQERSCFKKGKVTISGLCTCAAHGVGITGGRGWALGGLAFAQQTTPPPLSSYAPSVRTTHLSECPPLLYHPPLRAPWPSASPHTSPTTPLTPCSMSTLLPRKQTHAYFCLSSARVWKCSNTKYFFTERIYAS